MGKVAFLFAGQGAQYQGMGKSLYENSAVAKSVFDMADGIRPGVMNLCFFAEKELLSLTINTQPCMFAVDLACASALVEAGVAADGAAGFSLGEIPAAAFCGLLTVEDAFRAVCKRAELMQSAAEQSPGAMTAVLKLPSEKVEELAGRFGAVYPVNYNCPGQVVVAAARDEIDVFEAAVKDAGGRAMRLAVSGAFHSPFMKQAAEDFADYLNLFAFNKGGIPLYANVNAKPYGEAPAKTMSSQINSPVRWQETIENMIDDGFDIFIEVGPGKTLSGLVKKISGDVKVFNVENYDDVQAVSQALRGE